MVGLIAKTKVADVVVIAETFATVMTTMIGTDSREKRMIVGDADFCKTYRHSRVGGKPQGRATTRQHSTPPPRHCGLDPQSIGAVAGHTTSQTNHHYSPSPLMETFAKLSGTAIVCSDYQSAKLGFLIDSHLRGNDGRFCKGFLMGEESKSLSQCMTLGSEGEQDSPTTPSYWL